MPKECTNRTFNIKNSDGIEILCGNLITLDSDCDPKRKRHYVFGSRSIEQTGTLELLEQEYREIMSRVLLSDNKIILRHGALILHAEYTDASISMKEALSMININDGQ